MGNKEDKQDGEKAQDLARSVKVEFDPKNIKFWFAQLEDEMEMATINRQWLKKSVLQRNLPNKIKEDVMGFLSLQKAEAGAHIYLDIKKRASQNLRTKTSRCLQQSTQPDNGRVAIATWLPNY